jgi:hypothetical protein
MTKGDDGMGLVLDTLNDVRNQIAAAEKVLKEAQERRNLSADSAMEIEGSLRSFRSGSVAHATVNKPVTDADGGVVLDRRNEKYADLGPDGQGEGPEEVVDELCDLVRPKIRDKYPKAEVESSRRGIYVEFNEPVNDEEDPTVDLIVTLTRKAADGLWIPDMDNDRWTPSHPERHTELFTEGTRERKALRAHVTRLAKAWNKQWDEDDRALSSFNIEALVWEFIDDGSVPLDQALVDWFAYARDEIEKADTKDPAGVSHPIRLLKSRDLTVKRLGSAADKLAHALGNEDDEDTAREDLSGVFWKYVDPPKGSKSAFADALRKNEGVGATKVGLTVGGGGAAMKRTPSYGGGGEDG